MASLAEDLKLALDRVAFARSIGFEPDEWQAEALRSTALRQLYNASRQSGKSTVAAVLAVHTALYDPEVAGASGLDHASPVSQRVAMTLNRVA